MQVSAGLLGFPMNNPTAVTCLLAGGYGFGNIFYNFPEPLTHLEPLSPAPHVQDAPSNPNDAALVDAILAVARHLNLRVVAEGVETAAQAEFLRCRGPILFQGCLTGRPEPAGQQRKRWLASAGRIDFFTPTEQTSGAAGFASNA